MNEPIRLSYHRGTHYNSVVNPYKATIGVGLGLPGFVPGLADHNLLTDAAKKSEDLHIEQVSSRHNGGYCGIIEVRYLERSQ